jgi:hypothetical protein
VGEIVSSCGAISYAIILYTSIGGGEQFGGGELVKRWRIVAAVFDGEIAID